MPFKGEHELNQFILKSTPKNILLSVFVAQNEHIITNEKYASAHSMSSIWSKKYEDTFLKLKPEMAHRSKTFCDTQNVDWEKLFSVSEKLFAPTSSTAPTTLTSVSTTWHSKSLEHLPQDALSVFAVAANGLDTLSPDHLSVTNKNNDTFINKFNSFQQVSLADIANKKFNYKKDLAKILSLSSIVIVDKKHPLTFLSQEEFSDILTPFEEIYNAISMPKQAYADISKVVIDFAASVGDGDDDKDDGDEGDDDEENDYDKWDLTQDLAKIAKKHKHDEAIGAIISVLISLAEELVDVEVDMSEMFVQTALVHPLIRSIAKAKKMLPHSSNKAAFSTNNIMACRPDYWADVYLDSVRHYTNLVGEVKPNDAKGNREALVTDLIKAAYYSKLCLLDSKTEYFLCFRSVGPVIKFYATKEYSPGLYILYRLSNVVLPTTIAKYDILLSNIKAIYKIAKFYKLHCFRSKSQQEKPSPSYTLPFSEVKAAIRASKRQKRQ
ncbi:hypothetical protein EDC96DRAFT_604367 [Choanephora cucurbitarum]|nr:hypothetical protein EDC96DRAFT_604367 [Choanephora cucurbitarum]